MDSGAQVQQLLMPEPILKEPFQTHLRLIPIISGVPLGSVLGPVLFILYTSEMFELVENRLFAYADDSTLPAVVRRPAV